LMDPHINYALYDRVLVITNWPQFGGQGGGPFWWNVNEGQEATFKEGGHNVGKRLMTLAVVNEWVQHSHGITTFDVAASVMAHELGHQLDVRTHYHDFRWDPGYKRDSITPWGIMGLSPGLNHFIGWAKAERGWIPGWRVGGWQYPRVRMVGPPAGSDVDTTITLTPQEVVTGGVQIIGVPLTALGTPAQFLGYVIENRRQIMGDGLLPQEGVLITLVDESPHIGPGRRCIVMDDPDHPRLLTQAPLEVGDSLSDATHNLTITVVSESANNYNIRIRYKRPPVKKPDLKITPWNAPPWETPDIWIDSQENGWGTYKHTDASTGKPAGNGDDAWVGHNNRVYIRVHNIGPGPASNVRVRLLCNEPPGMGAAGPKWTYCGTVVIPSIAAKATVENWVNWRPTVGKHTCLRAVIENQPGELSTTNNEAQENVAHFETSSSSPYQPVTLTMRVSNPFKHDPTPVRTHVRDIPEGWAVEVDPEHMLLMPDGDEWVTCTLYPSGPPDRPISGSLEDLYQPGYIGKPKIEALAPYADTFIPIGGVDLWTNLVLRTELSMFCDPGGDDVYIGGQLIPGLANAKITLEFTAHGIQELRYATTDSSGHFSGTYRLGFAGPWRAQGHYAGNGTYGMSKSSSCRFDMEGLPETPPPGPILALPQFNRNLYDKLVDRDPNRPSSAFHRQGTVPYVQTHLG
ncbi:CARDB domain-containing protein, partial [Planctomycetota bacterium]